MSHNDLTPSSALPSLAGAVGALDGVSASSAIGWVWDPRNPNTPAAVEFVSNGQVLFSATADSVRDDVAAAGFGQGLTGFSAQIPLERLRGLCSGDSKITIHVRLAGTDRELLGSPKTIYLGDASDFTVLYGVKYISNWVLSNPPVKFLAFYLPQFHPFKENNEWWGPGFTEWTNVTRAKPQFYGHYQPHRPGELGYYDLRLPEVQERQVDLARTFGVSGFCFYFYWFGDRILMERPIQQFSENEKIDFPFCLCWANENWTRKWDGLDSEVLISQNYSRESDSRFIEYVEKYFRHKNYIRVDGRPLLLVYRTELLPYMSETADRWRDYCRSVGIGEIYLVCVQSFLKIDPSEIGFDSASEFPPHNMIPAISNKDLLDLADNRTAPVLDYRRTVESVNSFTYPAHPLIRGVFPGWDNTARRGHAATIFIDSSPETYLRYAETVARQVIEHESAADQRLVFVNAWNEWAEGARLEPDERSGYAYLEATRMALIRAGTSDRGIRTGRFGETQARPRLAVIVHAFYLDILGELISLFSEYDEDVEFFLTTTCEQTPVLENIMSATRHTYAIYPIVNRGRDVAPFLDVLTDIWPRRFQYILKLHTKRSVTRDDGERWRWDMLNTVARWEHLQSILEVMGKDDGIGVVGPTGHILSMPAFYGSNRERVHALGRRMGMTEQEIDKAVFVAGTMFVARPEALEALMGLSLTSADFEAEAGQADGTLAHALERAIGLSPGAVGMKIRGISFLDHPSGVLSDTGATVYPHARSSPTGSA